MQAFLHALSAESSAVLLDAAVKGTVILALAAAAMLAMRRTSAAIRHAVWLLAITGLLALPVLCITLPGWHVLPDWCGLTPKPAVDAGEAMASGEAPLPREEAGASVGVEVFPIGDAGVEPSDPRLTERPESDPAGPPMPTALEPMESSNRLPALLPEPAAAEASQATPWINSILPWLGGVWASGTAVLLILLLLGRLSLWRLGRRSHPLRSPQWTARLEAACAKLRLSRPVLLLESDERPVPMIWGVVRPKLLLPSQAEAWPESRCRAVLLHELGHVKRRDCLSKLLAQLACALYWLNPLVWVASKLMQLEAERACDDLVINSGAAPRDYASDVLEIASGSKTSVFAMYSAIAMARRSRLEGRLLAILDRKRNRRPMTLVGALAAAALIAGAAAVVASVRAAAPDEARADRVATEQPAETSSQPVAIETASGGPSQPGVPSPAGARVALVLDRNDFLLGENITVCYRLENVGQELLRYERGAYYPTLRRHKAYAVTMTPVDASGQPIGKPLEPVPEPQDFGGLAGRWELKPGEVYQQTLYLPRYVRLDQPGRFRLRIVNRGRLFVSLDSPLRKQVFSAGETVLTLKVPTPQEARELYHRMKKLPQEPVAGIGERRDRPIADFEALIHPVYLAILREQALEGDRDALLGLGKMWTAEANGAVIDAIDQALGKDDLDLALAAYQQVSGLPDPRDYPGFYPDPKAHETPDAVARRAFVERTWRAEFTETLRRLASRLARDPQLIGLGETAKIYECVGTAADMPDLALAYSKSIERTKTLPMESQYFRPRGSAYSYRFAAHELLKRGAEVPLDPQTPGEAAVYLIAMRHREDFRPSDWPQQVARWLEHETPYMRELVLEYLPDPIPEGVLRMVPKLMADEYVDLQIAACHTARKHPREAFREPLLEILRNGTEEHLLNAATQAAAANGIGNDQVMEIWLGRMDSSDLGGKAVLRLLLSVLDDDRARYVDKLDAGVQAAAEARWDRFIREHREELRQGRRFKLGDPQITPDLFPRGFQFYFQGKPWPADADRADGGPAAEGVLEPNRRQWEMAAGESARGPSDLGPLRETDPRLPYYRYLYAMYRLVIKDQIAAGDKGRTLQITEEFNKKHDSVLIYAGVGRKGTDGKMELLLSEFYGRDPFALPAISYDANVSGTVQVTQFNDYAVIETANPADGTWVRLLVAKDKALQDESEDVRRFAAAALERIRNPGSSEWGEAVEGVQVRLRPDKPTWALGEVPTLKAEIRNQGTRDLSVAQAQPLCKLEVDGRWHDWVGVIRVRSSWFPPGREYKDIPVSLVSNWHGTEDGNPVKLGAGKHTVRVAFICRPGDVGDSSKPHSGTPVRAVSNPVEIEIVAEKPAPDAEKALEGPSANNDRVTQLIDQLGDRRYAKREAAERELIRIGEPACAALKAAQKHEDPEIAVRAKRAFAEIGRRIEALRGEHREAAAAAVERSDRVTATRHYKALLALPDPPLRDCRAACEFFEAQQAWESLATAQEATAQEMKRVIHTPAEQFTRPAPPRDPVGRGPRDPVGRGPTVLVQTGLDGIWVNGKGTADNWTDWLTRKQNRMKQDRFWLLVKLGRLYRDRLSRLEKAVAALAEAMYDVEFFTDPIDKVIARDWPVRPGEHKEVHGPAGGSYVGTLRELSEMQQQGGDLDGAIETKTRQLLAGFVLAWNHRDGTVNRCARELWSLVQQLPADAPLPPLFWFNVLSPEQDTITFDLSKPEAQRDVTDVYHPNVVARPGYAFDTLEVTADMESLGGLGVVHCYTVFEKNTVLGQIRWHPDGPGQKGRQRITEKFTIPKGTGLVRFGTTLGDEHRVHAITVKATFRPEAAEPAETSFGPVIERILRFNFMEDAAHLDLDTGNHGRNQAGRDLIAAAGESDARVRAGLDMVAIPVDAKRWDASPNEILAEVADAEPQRQARLGGPESRRTFLFKTREGGVGVLRIAPMNDATAKVKVLYQMVRGIGQQPRLIEMVPEQAGPAPEASAPPLPDWARAVVRVFADWEVVQCDRRPSVETHGAKGSRLLLRRGRREYIGQQQQETPRTEPAADDVNYRTVYSHVDVVVFPSADALPDNAAPAIPWEEVEQEWFARPVDLGLGLGYRWFARTTIFWQEDLRAKLGLTGGDDRLQLLVDGLTVKDRGDCTANSVILLVAKAGDQAIPYLEAALERTTKEDAWRLPQPLGKIDTRRATDLLVTWYGDEKTRDAAGYALISGAPRKDARQIYFDLLRRRQYVHYAGEACVAFGWQDAVPLLQEICDRPTNWDFRSAFGAKRRLEGRPLLESLAEAERVLTGEGRTGSDPAKVDAAKRALLATPDKEGAAIVAAHLADFNTKASSHQLEAVRRIGRELLHALPADVTKPLLEKLIAGFPDARDRQRLEQVLQSLDAGQS